MPRKPRNWHARSQRLAPSRKDMKPSHAIRGVSWLILINAWLSAHAIGLGRREHEMHVCIGLYVGPR